MIPKSIRWRLPLSYAAIALLTALAVGALLLTTLRGYYRDRELDYLAANAQAIGTEIARLLEVEFPLSALQSQLTGFAFLSQTRIRVVAPDGQVIADSGSPDEADGSTSVMLETLTTRDAEPDPAAIDPGQEQVIEEARFRSTIVVIGDGVTQGVEQQVTITSSQTEGIQAIVEETRRETTRQLVSRLPVSGTPFGFGLSQDLASGGPRSNLTVRRQIDGAAGNLLGHVELSQGPAYGRDILESVAYGWAIASSVAVVLAAIVGWFASLRLSDPLIALKQVTTSMAAGMLSSRAQINRQDELGDLSHSFNKMAERVEDTVLTLRRFVADAAHELHTPLTALRTDLELLAQETGNTTQMGRIERARTQVSRLEASTSGLLDLSRLEANGVASEMVTLDLGELIVTSSELYASRAEQVGLDFSLKLPGKTLIVRGNESQLSQAFDNLLDNAVKFTPEGGSVQVIVQRVEDWATVTVCDTGIGIHQDDMAGLFGRFHRGRNAVNYPGSGLGLAIVRAIVAAHGGQVRCNSDSENTRFVIKLPAR